MWCVALKNWERAVKGEDLSAVLDWYLTPQGAKVQTENLSWTISGVGNRRRNRRGWFPFSRAGGNHSCEMCQSKQLSCIIRHLYNCHWNCIPKPSRHILQSRELMCASPSTALLEQCTCSCWGCSRKNQEQVLREDNDFTEDLWYMLKKLQPKQCCNHSYWLLPPELLWIFSAGWLHFIALLSTAAGQEQLLQSDTHPSVCILTPPHGYGFRQVFGQPWGCSPAPWPWMPAQL